MVLMCNLWFLFLKYIRFLCVYYESYVTYILQILVILEVIISHEGIFVKQARDFSQAPDIKIHIRLKTTHKIS